MPLRHLWAGWPCRRPVRRTLRRARMPLRHLWKGFPCQSADRSPLRHAVMPLRYLWAGSPCRRQIRASVSCRSWTGRLAVRHARMPLRHLWAGSPCRKPVRRTLRRARMPLRHLWKGSPCRSRLWEGLGWCSKQRPLWFARAGWGNRKGTVVASTYSGSPPQKKERGWPDSHDDLSVSLADV